MKRHRILEPFSRDHNEGLVAARQLINKADKEALALCLMVWEEGMEDHFREEEELLTDLAPQEMGAQLREEHEEIRRMIGVARQGIATEDDLRSLGKKIEEHIRWEERVLFPVVQESEGLESIAEKTEAMERRHQGSTLSPRRAELVERRNSLGNG